MARGVIAPESILRAYSHLLYRVLVHARFYSTGNQRMSDAQLFDLMDAVHNVPLLLTGSDEYFNDQLIRELYLAPYDAKWASQKDAFSLIGTLNEAMRDNSK